MTTNDTQPSSSSARTWVLALTSVAALMVALDALVVTTALSTIRLHLHASIEQLEWTVNAYALSFAVLLMTSSALGDRFERRAWALGIFSSVTGLAVLGGPVVGGAITQGIAWQWIFWLNVPIGLLTIPLILRRIDESFGPKTRLDVGGVILETGAALGATRRSSSSWHPSSGPCSSWRNSCRPHKATGHSTPCCGCCR